LWIQQVGKWFDNVKAGFKRAAAVVPGEAYTYRDSPQLEKTLSTLLGLDLGDGKGKRLWKEENRQAIDAKIAELQTGGMNFIGAHQQAVAALWKDAEQDYWKALGRSVAPDIDG
jgi:hypothetical protein